MARGWLVSVGLLGAAISGCGGAARDPSGGSGDPMAAPVPSFESGTRFQARYLTVAGTDPLLLGVHDAERDVDCAFAEESDGSILCAPLFRSASVAAAALRADRSTLDPADPADVVTGELRLEMRTSRLGVRELATSDGGRFPLFRGRVETFDTYWNTPCSVVDVFAACLPPFATHTATFRLYADGTCARPVAMSSSASPPLLAMMLDEPYAVEAAWTGDTYQGSDSACSLLFPATSEMPLSWLPGARLPDDAIVALSPGLSGRGRLALRVHESEGRIVAPMYELGSSDRFFASYLDRERGHECTPVRTPSSGVRCVGDIGFTDPTAALYQDPACTQMVLHPSNYVTAQPGSMLLYDETSSDFLMTATAGYRVESWFLHAGPTLYEKTREGVCNVRSSTKVDWAILGEPLDWESYPELEDWLGSERIR